MRRVSFVKAYGWADVDRKSSSSFEHIEILLYSSYNTMSYFSILILVITLYRSSVIHIENSKHCHIFEGRQKRGHGRKELS